MTASVALITALAAANVPPLPAGKSMALIRGSIERTRAILLDPELRSQRSERLAQLRREANAMTDWEEMAQRCAATHWSSMTLEQRQRFHNAFKELLLSSHLQRLDQSTPNQSVEVVSEERVDGSEVWVNAKLTGARFFELTFGFLVSSDRVVDVRLGSFRLTDHFRESIGRTIQNVGVEETVRRLETKAAAAARGF